MRRKTSFALANSLYIITLYTSLRGSRSVYYTSNTYSENSSSSVVKVNEVTSDVDATLLSF